MVLFGSVLLSGCVSDTVDVDRPALKDYQEHLVQKAPQKDLLRFMESLEPAADPVSGGGTIELSVEEAVTRVLANSPEISVVSFDPSIAQEEITQSVSAFDPVLFSEFNYEDQNDPTDSIFLGGQSTSRLWEAGIKQRGTTGAEWSLGYALTQNWDDLSTRTLPTRYEPIATFQIRQSGIGFLSTANRGGFDGSDLVILDAETGPDVSGNPTKAAHYNTGNT